jgi:hypothetical protein
MKRQQEKRALAESKQPERPATEATVEQVGVAATPSRTMDLVVSETASQSVPLPVPGPLTVAGVLPARVQRPLAASTSFRRINHHASWFHNPPRASTVASKLPTAGRDSMWRALQQHMTPLGLDPETLVATNFAAKTSVNARPAPSLRSAGEPFVSPIVQTNSKPSRTPA